MVDRSALEDSGMAGTQIAARNYQSVLMQNTFATLATLHELRKLGVQIAMDDFRHRVFVAELSPQLPVRQDQDRSFLHRDFSNGAEPLAIVHAVAGLAKCLNMVSTAEGVETQQQLDKLQSVGCTEMQGYLFSRARPAVEIERLFMSSQAKAAGNAG